MHHLLWQPYSPLVRQPVDRSHKLRVLMILLNKKITKRWIKEYNSIKPQVINALLMVENIIKYYCGCSFHQHILPYFIIMSLEATILNVARNSLVIVNNTPIMITYSKALELVSRLSSCRMGPGIKPSFRHIIRGCDWLQHWQDWKSNNSILSNSVKY